MIWLALGVTLAPAGDVTRVASPWEAPIPRVERRLPLGFACADRRLPALAGTFVLHCGPGGDPDRVLDLSTGEVIRLGGTAEFGIARDALYALGPAHGRWVLPAGRPEDADQVRDVTGRPGFDGERVAVAGADAVEVFAVGDAARKVYPAHPAPWYPPAVGDWVVWTEHAGGSPDVWGLPPGSHDPQPIAVGEGVQHHPAADGRWAAWVDRGDVWVADLTAGEAVVYEADAGFEGPPVLHGDHACWGDRADGLVVRCSDGWSRPGRRPTGGGPLLLVHDEHGPVLVAAEHWPVAAIDGQVGLEPWWGLGGVTVWARDGEGWVEVASVEVGRSGATIPVPEGVDLRVVPDHPLPRGVR